MSFTIRIRGANSGPITHEYLCEEHGRFDATVERASAPDAVPCPECGVASPWSPSSAPAVHTQFVVSATQGRSAPKPHPDAMDTRMLAEGRKNDYRKQRKAVREKLRHERVKALLS